MSDQWTEFDAVRVMGIALFRFVNRTEPGSLPWNGTEGDIRFGEAERMFAACPGLRRVIEEGVDALSGDPAFEGWLMSLYSGDRDACRTYEHALGVPL